MRALFGYAEADKSFNILSVFSNSDIISYIKSGLMPIGVNVFGDYFLIRINGDDYGAVYFRYHDKNVADIYIANSFKAFVSKCKSVPVGHIRTIEERKADLIANGYGHLLTPEKMAGWQAEIDRYKNIVQEKVEL